VGIVDTDNHFVLAVTADQPVDHLAHPPQRIGTEVAGDAGERTQRNAACRCCADNPVSAGAAPTTGCDGFTRHSSLADTRGSR
jgi:hypothetical protein